MPDSLSLLPLSPAELQLGIEAAFANLDGIETHEANLLLNRDFEEWLDADHAFPDRLKPILEHATWGGTDRANVYRQLVSTLSDSFDLSRRRAVALLSELPLILRLARDGKSSPARIAVAISNLDSRFNTSWKMIEKILRRFHLNCDLTLNEVSDLLEDDKQKAIEKFSDSDLNGVVLIIGKTASSLGLPTDFSDALKSLFTPMVGNPFIPYLQTLLYVCVIDEFYDHHPEFLYTFSPRGKVANHCFSVFPDELAPTGNPVLNNFKAVDRVGRDWATARTDNLPQAQGLVVTLANLATLPWTPRRTISRAIRQAIFRLIEIVTPPPVVLPTGLGLQAIKSFLRAVANAESNTKGVIEQRITDLIAVSRHDRTDWRFRGLGDSINATNTSSNKLGDCDAQNIIRRTCFAYESHAGRISNVYVEEHLRTLHLSLPNRRIEWDLITSDPWQINLVFLVHQDSSHLEEMQVMEGMQISIETFADAIEELCENYRDIDLINAFDELVIGPLNEGRTPHEIKLKAAELIGQYD